VAPYLIIKEAGGIMTDLNGVDLDFDLSIDSYLKNYKVIASGKHLHNEIIALIDEM
jgi:fructose-1,6-bisphosphatase/inositol monophosphatase family enzyme